MAEMKRGATQVLFEFAPGALFDYGHRSVSMMVKRWDSERLEGINRERIADRLKILAGMYRNYHSLVPPDSPDEGKFKSEKLEFRTPKAVYGQIYPLLFVCENKECGRVVTAPDNKPTMLRSVTNRGYCPSCGETMRQLPFVLACSCGTLTPISINPCSKHGFDHLRLRRPRTDPESWEFRCTLCGDQTGDLSTRCSNNSCSEYLHQKAIGGSSTYYVQGDRIVNIPLDQRYSDEIEYGESFARILMAVYLGDLDLREEDTTIEEISRVTEAERRQATIEEKLNRLKEEVGESLVEEMIEKMGRDKAFTVLSGAEKISRGPDRERIVAENRKRVRLPAESRRADHQEVERAYSNVTNELLTFIRATEGYEGSGAVQDIGRQPKPIHLDEFLENEAFLKNNPRAYKYQDKLEKIGVSNAWIVDNLPVLSYVYGYTRGDPDKRRTDLRLFPDPLATDRVPIYATETPSEGIFLEVNRKRVIDWLLEAEIISPSEAPDTKDDYAMRVWFLEHVDTTQLKNPYEPIQDEITKKIYTLLHSMSHALILTGSGECGLDRDSLGELIYPTIPAIALYATNSKDFRLGGMFTLFKARIHPWIDNTIEHIEQCVYDPVCTEEGGACHACLFTSEFVCNRLNRNLSRNVLVGGEDYPAFWRI